MMFVDEEYHDVQHVSIPNLGNDLGLSTCRVPYGARDVVQVGDTGAATTCTEVPWFDHVFPYQKTPIVLSS